MKKKVMSIYSGPKSDDWETPDWIFEPLNKQYKFTFDLAASKTNTKCKNFFSEKNSALDVAWPEYETCWLNPPFSKAEQFFYNAGIAAQFETSIVAIYKSTNLETSSWQDWILPTASWVCFVNKRVNYLSAGKKTSGVPFGSALIGWNVQPPNNYLGYTVEL